ncbi:phage tail tape measure protein [Marinobacterium stanieri]|uniref:phage tail tape measure protein n=1 Tax=Marinobacterium stanieri TaxID=49186 RepID=UPI0002558F0F|nr:phage tail tape measure protein [Marinobacterium stanieri]
MASNSKNQDVVELIIKGQDEYSDVSEEVRQELEELAGQAYETRTQFDELERSLDLAGAYREQEEEVNRLARAQAEAKQEVDRLTKANKESKGESLETVEALARAKAELGSYRTATNRAQKALDKTKDSMRQYGVSLEEVEQNQSALRQSSEQLADELTELQVKQRNLVADAREQVQAAQDKARSQNEYNDALREQGNVMAEQFRTYSRQQAEQKRVQAETEKLTSEIQDQIAQLQRGDISWSDYQRRVRDAGTTSELTRKQVAEINRSLEDQALSAREAAAEQARVAKEQEESAKRQRLAMDKLRAAYEQRVEAAHKARLEDQRVAAESERLTNELKDLAVQLERGDIGWEDFRRRAQDAGRAAELTQKQVAEVRRRLEELVTSSRQANQALADQARETKRVEQATEDYRVELEKLLDKYRAGKVDIDGFEQAESDLRRKLKLNEEQVQATRQEMGAYREQLRRLPQEHAGASKSTDRLTQVTRRLAQAYTVLLAAQKSLDVAMTATRAYTESEDAMLGLQKTTSLAATEINGLVDEFQRLSGDVSSTAKSQLLAIAEAAGRMGVEGADNIGKFTKSIDALTSASDLAGDETAQAIAQILNVTGEAQSNVVGVAAAIAELGNSTATTEDQIVHFAKRLASDTATVNLTSAEVLGLSASLAEMGLQAEGTGTVVGRTFRYIEDAVKGGGAPMQELQRITGQTSEQIEQAFGQNKVQLFIDFVAGMSRVQDGGATLNSILSDMGIKSDENARILGLLSQTYQGVGSAVDSANQAFERGQAHFEEMAKKEAALSSGMLRLQNRAKSLAGTIGEAFSDDLLLGMDQLAQKNDELDESLSEVGETAADIVIQIADLADTLSGVLEPLEVLMGGVGVFDGLLTGLSMNIDAISVALNLMTGGIAELGIAWNKFFGDTDDVEAWTKVQEDAFERVDKSVKRYNDNLDRLDGKSSRAFQDLRDVYNENRDALERMDAEQRKAVETIIQTTGYLEGNDAAYRTLTRAIQRAAEERRILKGLTEEEGTQLKDHIELLLAQGKTQEEAAAIARKTAFERKQAAEQETSERRQQIQVTRDVREELEYLQRTNERMAEADAKASQDSVAGLQKQAAEHQKLRAGIEETVDGLGDFERNAVSAFDSFVGRGVHSSDKVMEAFQHTLDNIKSHDAVEQLKQRLLELGEQGFLSAQQLKAGLEQADQELLSSNRAISEAWRTLKLDVDEVTGALTEQGEAGAKAFETLVQSGEYTSGQLKQAFDAAISQATTKADLEALIDILERAGQQGKAAGDLLAYGFLEADRQLSALKSNLDGSLKNSLRDLGIDVEKIETGFSAMGREALDRFDDVQKAMDDTGVSGKKAAEITKEAFDAVFDDISTKKGLDELKGKITEAFRDGRMAASDYREALLEIDEAYAQVQDGADASTKSQLENLREIWAESKKVANAIANVGDAQSKAAGSTDEDTQATVENTNAHEKSAYQKRIDSQATKDVSEASDENAAANDRATASIDRSTAAYKERQGVLKTLAGESDQVTAALANIQEGAGQIMSQFGQLTTSSHSFFDQLRRRADYLRREQEQLIETYQREEAQVERINQALEEGRYVSESMLDGIQLIDSQKLDGLRQSIRQARDEAKGLAQDMESTVATLRQQLAELRGDQAQSEQLAQEQRMLELREQYESARQAGNAAAARSAKEAISLQQQIYRERMRQIRDAEREESKPVPQSGVLSGDSQVESKPEPRAPLLGGSDSSNVVRIELDLGAGAPVSGYYESSEADLLIRQLQEKRSVT